MVNFLLYLSQPNFINSLIQFNTICNIYIPLLPMLPHLGVANFLDGQVSRREVTRDGDVELLR